MDQRAKFILHWLDQSRAHRILWALEILALEYEVKVYLRHPSTWRGPNELFKVHPLGKAPILEVIFDNGDPPLKLVETGHILLFLMRYYDPDHLLWPTEIGEQLQVDYWVHYSEGTLQPVLIALLINSAAKKILPFGLKWVTNLVTKGINNGYYLHEWKLNMRNLEKHLTETGTGYFVGNRLTGADVMLSFPIFENMFDNEYQVKEIVHSKESIYKKYPQLAAWSDRISKNPLYIKIDEMMDEKIEEHIMSKSTH